MRSGPLDDELRRELHKRPIRVADALWVGEVEPRVLALLPALLIDAPSMFEDTRELPEDLAEVVAALRHNETPSAFRGIPGEELRHWLSRGARAERAPSRLKAFRLKPSELLLLGELSAALGVTETDVVRAGLRELAAKHLEKGPKNV